MSSAQAVQKEFSRLNTPASPATIDQMEKLLHERRLVAFVRELNQAMALNPSADLCRLMSEYARLKDDAPLLQKSLISWHALAPDDPEPLLQLADLFISHAILTQALEALDLAELTGKRLLEIRLRKARLAIMMHRMDDAMRHADAAIEITQPNAPESVLLYGLRILAANLATAENRSELAELLPSVAHRVASLHADSDGLFLRCDGLSRKLACPDRHLNLLAELTGQIKTRQCSCILGSADLFDLAVPTARVHNGSFWGSRSRVYLVECDEDMLALALATFDLREVLADEAMTWIWGPKALERLEHYLVERQEESPQNITVSANPQVSVVADKASAALQRRIQANYEASAAYYASLPKEHWADIFGESPSRPPRILLITTEFSSYLKFATRDLATAFERMGWQVHVAKESQPTHRMNSLIVPQSLAALRPDLIWQINYTRNAWQGAIPDGVPFVCWDQDVMLHMTSPEQARAFSRFDFLAHLGSGVNYFHDYGYPQEQLIPLSICIDKDLFHPESDTKAICDISYISHYGQTMDTRILQALEGVPPQMKTRTRAAVTEYAQCLDTRFATTGQPVFMRESAVILAKALQSQGIDLPDKEIHGLNDGLFRLIANALWRHQAVRMVSACGVNLKLYGLGWHENPEFSKYAEGVLDHGQPLAQAIHASRIVLQAVLTGNDHQRLWEAAACGTITLMRYHPGDEYYAKIRSWMDLFDKAIGRPIEEAIPESIRSDPAGRLAFTCIKMYLVRQDGILSDSVLRALHHLAGFTSVRDKLTDIYDEVSFRTPQQLRSRLENLLHDETARRRISEKMLQAVEHHDYEIQIPRIIRRIRQRLLG